MRPYLRRRRHVDVIAGAAIVHQGNRCAVKEDRWAWTQPKFTTIILAVVPPSADT
jgi:hypothetical protein